MPSNPLETELLNLSEMVPEHDGKTEASDVAGEFVPELLTLWSSGVVCVNQKKGLFFLFFCVKERLFKYNNAVMGYYIKLES